MPIEGGFVGMVDREVFDEWLRERAAAAGAERRDGASSAWTRDADGDGRRPVSAARGGTGHKSAASAPASSSAPTAPSPQVARAGHARAADRMPFVFAYHEIVRRRKRARPATIPPAAT